MGKKLILGVYRRLDETSEKMAVNLHNKRKIALENVFEDNEILKVSDWGETKDESSHEFVEIILALVGIQFLIMQLFLD